MNWTFEVVVVPVADVDTAKAFYADRLGFSVDHDVEPGPGNRVVQLTPPGSGCSIVIGCGAVVPELEPGTLRGLQLVVSDIGAAHTELTARGVEVSDVTAVDGDAEKVSRGGAALDTVGFCYFADPDGNAWAVQQISTRA